MFIVVPAAHVSPPPPPPPPIVQNCDYQVDIGSRVYKCYSESEYQEKLKKDKQEQEESSKAFDDFFKVWWHDALIILGVIILAILLDT